MGTDPDMGPRHWEKLSVEARNGTGQEVIYNEDASSVEGAMEWGR